MIMDILYTNPDSKRLRELVREMGLPLRRLPEILSLSPQDCLAWWSEQGDNVKVSSKHFSRLASLVGINETDLFGGSYDRALARQRILGDSSALPERYQENPNSYLRTSEHIYKYMVLTRGSAFADQVLTSLNVSPSIYKKIDRLINLTYFADLLSALAKKGFSQSELDTLASVIFLSLQSTSLGHKLEESEDFFEVYSTLSQNYSYFDSNFEYKSEFVGKKYILKTALPLNQHQQLQKDRESVQRLMRYRHILLAWFPYLAGLTPLFPKAEVLRHSDVVEMRYEFQLSKNSTRPLQLLTNAGKA